MHHLFCISPFPSNRQLLNVCLLGNANDTAGWTSTSISRLLALLVAALAEIVGSSVDDDSATKHALRADQLDEAVLRRALAIALAVSLEVAEVSDMAVAVLWRAVLLVVWIDWRMGSV